MDNKIVKALNEQGKTIDLILLETFMVNENKYALLTKSENDEEALIYKVIEKDGNESFEFIDDDEEYNDVFDAIEENLE